MAAQHNDRRGGARDAALIDVSDTEWRLECTIISSADHVQHSLMSAILNGGRENSLLFREKLAALIDVSDTEWRFNAGESELAWLTRSTH